jgi:hypothetical protein
MALPRTYTLPTTVHERHPTSDPIFEQQLACATDIARRGINPLTATEVTDERVRRIVRTSIRYVEEQRTATTCESGRTKGRGKKALRDTWFECVPRFVLPEDIVDDQLFGYPMLPPPAFMHLQGSGYTPGLFLLHDEMDYHVLALVPPSETCLFELPLKQYGNHRDVRALGRLTSALLDKRMEEMPGRLAGHDVRFDLHVFVLERIYQPMLPGDFAR